MFDPDPHRIDRDLSELVHSLLDSVTETSPASGLGLPLSRTVNNFGSYSYIRRYQRYVTVNSFPLLWSYSIAQWLSYWSHLARVQSINFSTVIPLSTMLLDPWVHQIIRTPSQPVPVPLSSS